MDMLKVTINTNIYPYIPQIEMLGVLMRITSFSLVSWLGPDSPFLLIWLINTVDAIILSWCSIIKKDKAYTLLNLFWVIIGVLGIYRAYQLT